MPLPAAIRVKVPVVPLVIDVGPETLLGNVSVQSPLAPPSSSAQIVKVSPTRPVICDACGEAAVPSAQSILNWPRSAACAGAADSASPVPTSPVTATLLMTRPAMTLMRIPLVIQMDIPRTCVKRRSGCSVPTSDHVRVRGTVVLAPTRHIGYPLRRWWFCQTGPVIRPLVLVVEDNAFTRVTVETALVSEGCTVVSVGTAREALTAGRVDCAVIDLHLGRGPTGVDVAQKLRRSNPGVGIVILTSFADPRLMGTKQPRLPERSVYVLKNELDSTSQLRQFVDLAMGATPWPRTVLPDRVRLSDTQIDTLRMLAEGCTNAEIARRRGVAVRTVEITLARIAATLGVQAKASENVRVLLAQAYFSMIGGGHAF